MFIQISLLLASSSSNSTMAVKKALILEKLIPVGAEKLSPTDQGNESTLEITAKGVCNDFDKLTQILQKTVDVISVVNINTLDNFGDSAKANTAAEKKHVDTKDAKAECIKILISFFGENGADDIKDMSPAEALKYSRTKVAGLIGEAAAQAFDNIEI